MRPNFARRVVFVAVLLTFPCLAACGGGGGGGAGGSPTTIQGLVSDVSTAAARGVGVSSESSQVSGIRVEARQGTQTLAVATTDLLGQFTLTFVAQGPIELVFSAGDVVLELALNPVPGTVVMLVVELRVDDEEVVVIEETPPIRCETGRFSLVDDDVDLLIDGRGGDCLRAENDCVVDIFVRSLTLVNCARCIDAESNAEIAVSTAPGGLTCLASEDGIRAASSSTVVVDALDGVDIDAGGSGIRAESSAQVVLASDGTCLIEAAEDAVRIESSAIVDLDDCADIVLDDG